jgi:hypothetical protein
MARTRDYAFEYARRIARGTAKGLTRSQARGHPKASERPARAGPAASVRPTADAKINAAIRLMHDGASLTAAAAEARVSPERLRRFIATNAIARREGRAWVMTDNRPRHVPIIIGSKTRRLTVPDFEQASKAGRYFNALGRFANTADVDVLAPFIGDGLTDSEGDFHPFETDPNDLFRYFAKDEPAFHEIYQIVSP